MAAEPYGGCCSARSARRCCTTRSALWQSSGSRDNPVHWLGTVASGPGFPSIGEVGSTKSVVIIGAGPRGVGVLERLGANIDLLGHGELEVHLIDPYPPGPGRVWRHAQSPLLRMNSMAEDVTMFTDDSVQCEGPIRPGPSLAQWASQ